MQKVDEIKRPLKIGEEFLVPCIVRWDYPANKYGDILFEEERYITEKSTKMITYITPVINCPHSDRENGQKEIHYHADFRFIKTEKIISEFSGQEIVRVINKHSRYVFCQSIRPEEKIHGELEYMVMPVVSEEFQQATPVGLIKNSNLKHKCISNGKCPHRGYDLSQVKPEHGIITCPLHGLMFDEQSKQLIPE